MAVERNFQQFGNDYMKNRNCLGDDFQFVTLNYFDCQLNKNVKLGFRQVITQRKLTIKKKSPFLIEIPHNLHHIGVFSS